MLSEPCNRSLSLRQISAQVRDELYEFGTDRALSAAINPKFHVIGLAAPNAGKAVLTLTSDLAKSKTNNSIRDSFHDDVILDMQWNHFNDNVLATCSADSTVKVWHVADDLKITCVRTLNKHFKNVEILKWHTTVDNVLLSYGADGKLIMWDLVNDRVIFDVFEDNLSSISFSVNASHIACVSISALKLKILNARTGDVVSTLTLPHVGTTPIQAIFINNERVLTFGSSEDQRRQIAVYNVFSSSTPVSIFDVDDFVGESFPIYDFDLKVLYLGGFKCSKLRVFEVLDYDPWLNDLVTQSVSKLFSRLTFISKRGLELYKCEIARLFMLSDNFDSMSSMSFTVPILKGCNLDIYPLTFGTTPATYLAEWMAGLDVEPILQELKQGFPLVTSKPVELRALLDGKKLLTTNLNNDKKFRFLSQVTKPDYRIVDERDDCDQIRMIEQVKQKLQSSTESFDINLSQSIVDFPSDTTSFSDYPTSSLEKSSCEVSNYEDNLASSINMDVNEMTNNDLSDVDIHEFVPKAEEKLSSTEKLEEVVSIKATIAEPEDISISEFTPTDNNLQIIENSLLEKAALLSSSVNESEPLETPSQSPILSSTIPTDQPVASRVAYERVKSDNIPIPGIATSASANLHTPPQFVERLHIFASPKSADDLISSIGSSVTSECRLDPDSMSSSMSTARRRPVDEPIDVETNPFKSCFDNPEPIVLTNRIAHTVIDNVRSDYSNLRCSISEEENGNHRKLSVASDISNSYSTDGQKLLENTINLLEAHLSRSDNKVRQLERICELQQKDIDSLRYEIEWKDKRIEFLQKALIDLESCTSRSPSSVVPEPRDDENDN